MRDTLINVIYIIVRKNSLYFYETAGGKFNESYYK